jgi:5'-deoxynucleotidase
MRNTYSENIQEHSQQVAVIAHALAVIRNTYFNGVVNPERIAVLAMYHDSNEIITGDMPTPIKYYNPVISSAYKEVEHISKEKLISMLPDELKHIYRSIFFIQEDEKDNWEIVKAADRIAAYIKCLEEEKAGNSEFRKASETVYKTIMEIQMPEIKYFMDRFIPSFSLSLDELE